MSTNFNDFHQTLTFIATTFADKLSRLNHILKVGEKVYESAKLIHKKHLEKIDPEKAYCAALLHDVGYLPELNKLNFHPLDGYYFLINKGFQDLAEWIVCHSNSPEMAEALGLERIPVSDHVAAKLITYWDTHVMQGGEVVSYEERMADIVKRHGEDSMVVRSHLKAEPRIKKIIAEIDDLTLNVP